MSETIILGGGMTGLAAGIASGFPVYEAEETPGGICASYYMLPGDPRRHPHPRDGAYRFELGGGHWIFGGDPAVLRFIRRLTPLKSYIRRSAIYLPDHGRLIPYPIQYHLRYLDPPLAMRALEEIVTLAGRSVRSTTMAEWLRASFGPTLCDLFFDPFHRLYTAGLWQKIAPQDAYKTPIDLHLVLRGALAETPQVGYNLNFFYPTEGLNVLAQRMAAHCQITYRKRVVEVDVRTKRVHFSDGSTVRYSLLLSTLPLNQMVAMAGLTVDADPDPATAVLVVNIGALKGPRCPDVHWLYVPSSVSGFHRVGFYSNVDSSFLPRSSDQTRVSLYVERAYRGSTPPGEPERKALAQAVVAELQAWGWIERVEVVDLTWIPVAYTWSWPGSAWRGRAIEALEAHDVIPIGRFARWRFQGIADSIRDGFVAGTGLRGIRQ